MGTHLSKMAQVTEITSNNAAQNLTTTRNSTVLKISSGNCIINCRDLKIKYFNKPVSPNPEINH